MRFALRLALPSARVRLAAAALFQTTFGLELRVLHGDELLESRLSRYGEAPLCLLLIN